MDSGFVQIPIIVTDLRKSCTLLYVLSCLFWFVIMPDMSATTDVSEIASLICVWAFILFVFASFLFFVCLFVYCLKAVRFCYLAKKNKFFIIIWCFSIGHTCIILFILLSPLFVASFFFCFVLDLQRFIFLTSIYLLSNKICSDQKCIFLLYLSCYLCFLWFGLNLTYVTYNCVLLCFDVCHFLQS